MASAKPHGFSGRVRCCKCKTWHRNDGGMVRMLIFGRTARFCDKRCQNAYLRHHLVVL